MDAQIIVKQLIKTGRISLAWVFLHTRMTDEEISNGPDWLRAFANAADGKIQAAGEEAHDMIQAEEKN